ncbi:hypothetical protein LIER_25407 [Lithospermum erythrorhizon]|uniref:Uncharacterized protein n=1 Tax=Lithospermum erythrorhizon TaxID=34254 RepID=A0AAV3R6S1_LITER
MFEEFCASVPKFTIGYLKIFKDHDLFANIAIPHDVAWEVANRLNDEDLGGNPLDSNVISAEPLAVCHPSRSTTASSEARTTPSATQTAEPTPADEVLAAASKCMEPNEVPFSTMIGDHLPLFDRAKVVKKVAKDPVVTTSQPAVAFQSS